MKKQDAYLVLDIGTGNVRSAIVTPAGQVLAVASADVRYYRDDLYPESIYFKPGELWQQLRSLTVEALEKAGPVHLLAATSTSQREGIVLVNQAQKAVIGLPNIDHRGREWENRFPDKSRIFELAGRYPTSLFSAYKLTGIRERRPDMWSELSFFLSISDWAAWELSGRALYEHSQASETLLYDVAAGQWSEELRGMFNMPESIFPALAQAGEVAGPVRKEIADSWGLNAGMPVIVGGGDTQMAIRSTQPSVGDVVIVSGTTTPVVKLEDRYIIDKGERTWTGRDTTAGRFVLEANAGVTGLNYQRLKEIFYPNEGYDIIEQELVANSYTNCVASLGSLIAGEKKAVTRGGFVFPVPVSHELTRGSFVWATLLDISFSIAANYRVLAGISGHSSDYIWACSGGLRSQTLRRMIAAITGKEIRIKEGFEQASVIGGAWLCNETLNRDAEGLQPVQESLTPDNGDANLYHSYFEKWIECREQFRRSS